MDKIVTAQTYLLARKRRATSRMKWRKRAIRRRRAFARKQSQECFQFMFMLAMVSCNLQMLPMRTLWTKERSNHWWEQVVKSTFTNQDWLENFRMSHTTFLYLCDKLCSTIAKTDTVMRKAITAELQVALTLWFLFTGTDYRTIGHLFGVSKSTVCLATKQVCAAIVEVLLPQYIQVPTGAALKKVVEGFQTDHGFPQCAGAVDGTHIPIVSPQECPADYYNRKGWHSIILQGTVDDRGRFIDVYVGWPARVFDARVFANSSLYQRGQNNTLFLDLKEKIADVDVPLVVLGDLAYPLLQWLMKAFPDNGQLLRQQKTFNYCLSRARVVVEHCYGRLKGRWRCLLKRLDVSIYDVPELVAACCVLHNICETHGDTFDEEWLDGVERQNFHESTSAGTSCAHPTESAVNIRNAFMSYLNSQ